jgi:hypothetical protein
MELGIAQAGKEDGYNDNGRHPEKIRAVLRDLYGMNKGPLILRPAGLSVDLESSQPDGRWVTSLALFRLSHFPALIHTAAYAPHERRHIFFKCG